MNFTRPDQNMYLLCADLSALIMAEWSGRMLAFTCRGIYARLTPAMIARYASTTVHSVGADTIARKVLPNEILHGMAKVTMMRLPVYHVWTIKYHFGRIVEYSAYASKAAPYTMKIINVRNTTTSSVTAPSTYEVRLETGYNRLAVRESTYDGWIELDHTGKFVTVHNTIVGRRSIGQIRYVDRFPLDEWHHDDPRLDTMVTKWIQCVCGRIPEWRMHTELIQLKPRIGVADVSELLPGALSLMRGTQLRRVL